MAEAGSQWLGQHKRNLKPSTIRVYKNALKSLNRLFGPVPVCKIDIGLILRYQEERSAKAGPHHINYELFVLQ
jgi:Phage integrase, N-terminal SAM-like domain